MNGSIIVSPPSVKWMKPRPRELPLKQQQRAWLKFWSYYHEERKRENESASEWTELRLLIWTLEAGIVSLGNGSVVWWSSVYSRVLAEPVDWLVGAARTDWNSTLWGTSTERGVESSGETTLNCHLFSIYEHFEQFWRKLHSGLGSRLVWATFLVEKNDGKCSVWVAIGERILGGWQQEKICEWVNKTGWTRWIEH